MEGRFLVPAAVSDFRFPPPTNGPSSHLAPPPMEARQKSMMQAPVVAAAADASIVTNGGRRLSNQPGPVGQVQRSCPPALHFHAHSFGSRAIPDAGIRDPNDRRTSHSQNSHSPKRLHLVCSTHAGQARSNSTTPATRWAIRTTDRSCPRPTQPIPRLRPHRLGFQTLRVCRRTPPPRPSSPPRPRPRHPPARRRRPRPTTTTTTIITITATRLAPAPPSPPTTP